MEAMNINKVGKILIGAIVVAFIGLNIVGDLVALGMVSSLLLRTIFLILFLIPIGIAWRGYTFALSRAQAQTTKAAAWKRFLIYTLVFLVISYIISYILGMILGSLA